MPKTTIARWEARGAKTWIELYQEDFRGKPSYAYSGDSCGGNIGWKDTPQEAIDYLEKRGSVYYYARAMKTFKRVI